MAFAPRRVAQEEIVGPKERETLAKRKAELTTEMDDRLAQMADSYEKQELIRKRDHALTKFPVFPVDLSIWIIAYFEDWVRDYDRVAMYTSVGEQPPC